MLVTQSASADTVSSTSLTVGGDPFAVAVNPAGTKAYVVNSGDDTLSIINIDPATGVGTVSSTTIPLPHLAEAVDVVFTGDGKEALVTDYATRQLTVIDALTDTVAQELAVTGEAWGTAISPDGTRAYVANSDGTGVSVVNFVNGVGTVSGTDLATGNGPVDVAFDPVGHQALVTNRNPGTVSVIDSQTNTVTQTLTVGSDADGVAYSPDGTKAYVANHNDDSVSVINFAAGVGTVASSTITVGTSPSEIAFSPDGTKAYVTNNGDNSVSVIDVATDTVSQTLTVLGPPFGVAFTPDSTEAFVTDQTNGKAYVISTDSAPVFAANVAPAGKVGTNYSLTLSSFGRPTYSVTAGALPAGLTLDAATGTISGKPTVAGHFTFTVTATNTSGSDTDALSITVAAAATAPTTPASGNSGSSDPLADTGAETQQELLLATGLLMMGAGLMVSARGRRPSGHGRHYAVRG